MYPPGGLKALKKQVMKEKIVIGMSGGVDSSAAAYLLKEQGYDVIGVTMTLWQETEEASSCFFNTAVKDAKRVAEKLKIPHYTVDFGEDFHRMVVDRFAEDYAAGRTPNPCVLCNRFLKWGKLLEFADSIGAGKIATGHYASVIKLPNGRYTVKRALSDKKDQAYALYLLTQEQLERTLMPLGGYDKEDIRKIAESIDPEIAKKRDSQEICFIPDDDHGAFLSRYLKERMPLPGNFVDKDGNVLGRHKGIVYYTIGQRKGLNIAAGHPVFVTGIRPETNEVVIGEGEDLFTNTLNASEANFMGLSELPEAGLPAVCKIRYAHKGAACVVYPAADGFKVIFDEPQRAVTKGQSAVLYEDGHILCGGIIR